MSEELKPCPFCGGYAETKCRHDGNDIEYFEAGCHRCNASRYSYGAMTDAIEAWNTRPKASPALGRLKTMNKGVLGALIDGDVDRTRKEAEAVQDEIMRLIASLAPPADEGGE